MDDNRNSRAKMPNLPYGMDERIKNLDSMSAVELAEEFERVWGEMDEDTYDGELLRAYLDALDRKAPLPEMPDREEAYARFTAALSSAVPEEAARSRSGKARPRRFAARVAIAAAIAVAVIFGAMITAQAAGVDVFGSIARWTEETFSFGESVIEPAKDNPQGADGKEDVNMNQKGSDDVPRLQATLDAYNITGIKAPEWMPEGYALEKIDVVDRRDYGFFTISAVYRNDEMSVIRIAIGQRTADGSNQVQKDDIIEVIEINTIEVYILKNENNYIVTWTDAEFDYRISGSDAEHLKIMAESMLTD